MEVLEQGVPAPQGGRGSARAWPVLAIGVVSLAMVGAAVVSGARWWSEQQALPDRLEITGISVAGQVGVRLTDGDSGWPGGLGTPDGSATAAVRLRLIVTGDPQRDERVSPAPAGPRIAVLPVTDVPIPAAGETRLDLTVAPTDCAAPAGPPVSPLVRSDGSDVAMSDDAQATLDEALRTLCAGAGSAPALAVRGGLVDTFFRDRTLVVTAALASAADRVVLTPLDGTALRGLGALDVPAGTGAGAVRLRWLISPGEMSPHTSLTGRVQAHSITDGMAYPWVLTVQPPRNLDRPLPRTPLRNDGVDLAEVAPRPALNGADVQTR